MTDLDVITNIAGFEESLARAHKQTGHEIREVRLAVMSSARVGELHISHGDGVIIVTCNEIDRYTVGIACMTVFKQVPREYLAPHTVREEQMLEYMRRQTEALEEIAMGLVRE